MALISEKTRKFFAGRRGQFARMEKECRGVENILWVHAASYGEFEEARPILEEIRKMDKVFFDGKKNNETRCALHLLKFILVLDEHHNELEEDISSDKSKNISENALWNIISVMDYIKNNLTADDLSQTAMAKKAGINKDYFSRVFKEVTGVGYSKWLNIVRVEKTISLLPEERLSLTEIAMLSGFKSIPSFNRVFSEYEKISPSDYRRKIRENINSSPAVINKA